VKLVLDRVPNATLVPMVLLLAVANIDKILHVFGTRGILAGLLLIALGFGVGWMSFIIFAREACPTHDRRLPWTTRTTLARCYAMW
jgi:hypothetical protein